MKYSYEPHLFIKEKTAFEPDTTITPYMRVQKVTLGSKDSIHIHFDIMSEEGTYYDGASSKIFEQYWGKLKEYESLNNQLTMVPYKLVEKERCQPLSYTLVLDYSASMKDHIDQLEKGVENFILSKLKEDEIMIVKFSNETLFSGGYEKDKSYALKQLRKNKRSPHLYGDTGIEKAYDTTTKYLQRLESDNPKHIIFFSDGAGLAKINTAIKYARKTKNTISFIDYGTKSLAYSKLQKTFQPTQNPIERVAFNSGGYFIRAQDYEELLLAFKEIRKRECNSYKLSFVPKSHGTRSYSLALELPHLFSELSFDLMGKGKKTKFLVPFREIVRPEQIPELQNTISVKPSEISSQSEAVKSERAPANNDIFELDVYFDSDSDSLKSSSEPALEELAEFLYRYSSVAIELRGHTDNVGSESYNQELSQRRCERVKNALIEKGVSQSRIFTKGFGESLPIATNITEEGRSRNRRTEARVITFSTLR